MWIPGTERVYVRFLDPAYIEARENLDVQIHQNMRKHNPGLPLTIRNKVITPLIGVRRDTVKRGVTADPLGNSFRGLLGGKG